MFAAAKAGGLRMKIVLCSLFLVLAGLCTLFAVKYTILKVRVAFADGQVAIFEDMKASAASTTDPLTLSGKLEYLVDYYPSGSKQLGGTQLDRVVEAARSNAMAAIIAHLRTATGKDLGNDPQAWLKEYPTRH